MAEYILPYTGEKIEEKLEAIDQISNNIEQINTSITGLNGDIAELNGDIAELNNKLDNLDTFELPTASSSTLGGVKIGNNITNSNGTISLSSNNVINALGYTPTTEAYVTQQIQASIKASWEASY